MNLAEALREGAACLRAAGIDDAQLEAELLLRHALDMSRAALFARLQEPLPAEVEPAYQALLRRRLAHEPAAYILGRKEFYGLELACSPAALIPRSETELLVEAAIEWAQQRSRLLIADVGTGNGAIAVALAVHLPEARIVAIDTSHAALALARRNAGAHHVAERIAFVQASLLAGLRRRFDLIVTNLPYIPSRAYAKLAPEICEHEPAAALRAGRRGTALIEALLPSASGGAARLRPGGLLLAEHAWNQGRRLREAAFASFTDARIETRRDLAGRERMLVVQTD